MRFLELCQDIVEIKNRKFNPLITGISLDNRKVVAGDLFIAKLDEYIDLAIERQAAIVLCLDNKNKTKKYCIPVIYIDLNKKKIAELVAKFYGYPARNMQLIGVTGTSGKTSCSQFIMQSFNFLEEKCGVIGTLGVGVKGNMNYFGMTTPDVVFLQESLKSFLENEISTVAIEVSSHGLHQERVAGINFAVGIFTNLSRDHLDYHKTMENYAQAKLKLLHQSDVAVVNANDKFIQQILPLEGKYYACGFANVFEEKLVDIPETSRVVAYNIQQLDVGYTTDLKTPWGDGELLVPLHAEFNLENALIVLTTLCSTGISLTNAINAIANLQSVPGRMQFFGGNRLPFVVVDYAHKPDALEKALVYLRTICLGKLICVFGCGGNRDKGKRSLMGEVADRLADIIILTDDNPRDENPEEIIADILTGIKQELHIKIEHDRNCAISLAIEMASSNDCILIAGKGAENIQLIKGRSKFFSDIKVVKNCLESYFNPVLVVSKC